MVELIIMMPLIILAVSAALNRVIENLTATFRPAGLENSFVVRYFRTPCYIKSVGGRQNNNAFVRKRNPDSASAGSAWTF